MKRFNEVLRQDYEHRDQPPNCYIEHVPSLVGSLCYFDEVQRELNTLDKLHAELRAKDQRIAALLDNQRIQEDHNDDLAQQVKSLRAALDEAYEELEKKGLEIVPPLEWADDDYEVEAPDTRTNQLINALYHDRARLEKALKHGVTLINRYKDALTLKLGDKLKDDDGNENPEIVYTAGLLSEWCHLNA